MNTKPDALKLASVPIFERSIGWQADATATLKEQAAEIEQLKAENAALKREAYTWWAAARDATNDDAARYAYAKTLEGQVVTIETFKKLGAAALDQALDDAMAEEAASHGEPQSAVAAAFGGLVQTPQG
jgi:hypothetical protein